MLKLNFDTTHFIQFINRSTCTSDKQTTCEDEQIPTAIETRFLGLFINNTLYQAYTKLGLFRHAVSPTICIANTLKIIYYSYFHSVMTYDLLFWGHSPDSIKIFRLQKKIIRIMMGCRSSDSCRNCFFNLKILPFPSQYIPSFLLFEIKK